MADLSDSPRQCESLGKSVPTVLQMVSQVPEYVKIASIVSNSSDRSELDNRLKENSGLMHKNQELESQNAILKIQVEMFKADFEIQRQEYQSLNTALNEELEQTRRTCKCSHLQNVTQENAILQEQVRELNQKICECNKKLSNHEQELKKYQTMAQNGERLHFQLVSDDGYPAAPQE
ncbi:hypothetical protein EMCRGX_G015119 [Ephydatia muelleri]